MYYGFTLYAEELIKQYSFAVPWWNTITIPFASFTSANAITGNVTMQECADDVLVTEIATDFNNRGVRVTVLDDRGWQLIQNNRFLPVGTLAGSATQTTPILPMPIEYLIQAHTKLYCNFQNAPTSPETVNRRFTCRGIRLIR